MKSVFWSVIAAAWCFIGIGLWSSPANAAGCCCCAGADCTPNPQCTDDVADLAACQALCELEGVDCEGTAFNSGITCVEGCGGAWDTPTPTPTETPTVTPTSTPTDTPTETPTDTPTDTPTETPTETPTNTPTDTPTETNTPTETPTDTPTVTPTPTNTPTSARNVGMLMYREVCSTPTCVSTRTYDHQEVERTRFGTGGGLKTVHVNVELADPNDTISVQAECQGPPGQFSPWVMMGSALTDSGKIEEDAWCEKIRMNVTAQTCTGACPAVSAWIAVDPPVD